MAQRPLLRVPVEDEVQFPGSDGAPKPSYLPEWARAERRPPLFARVLGVALLAPLLAGAAAVHLLAGRIAMRGEEDEHPEEGVVQQTEYSRQLLSWSLHYGGALLSFAGAMHWGMQLAEFGVPLRSDYMAIYYLGRYTAPLMFVLFGWLASVLSATLPREGCLWLLCGYSLLFSFDLLTWSFNIAPPWWFRWRACFSGLAALATFVLLLSERNLYLGQKPTIQM